VPDVYAGDVRVHYEVTGDGPPLVLQHGFGDSSTSWFEYGYVDVLSRSYRIILIDSRGHGQSDKPHDPSSYGTHLASDVIAVLDDIGIEHCNFYGYALGGWIGLVLAKLWPKRFASIVVGGLSPVESTMPEAAAAHLTHQLQAGAAAFTEIWEAQAIISPELRGRLLSNDMVALAAIWDDLVRNPVYLEDALPNLPAPYLLIFGELDALYPMKDIRDYSSRLTAGSVVTLPDINHLEAFQRSDLVLSHLVPFLETANAPSQSTHS
jgi:pimeloyl-ACP methyl ester carboxylesterase